MEVLRCTLLILAGTVPAYKVLAVEANDSPILLMAVTVSEYVAPTLRFDKVAVVVRALSEVSNTILGPFPLRSSM